MEGSTGQACPWKPCKITAPTSDLGPVDLVSPDKPLAMKPGSAAKVLPSVFIKSYGPREDFPKHESLNQGKFHAKTWVAQPVQANLIPPSVAIPLKVSSKSAPPACPPGEPNIDESILRTGR